MRRPLQPVGNRTLIDVIGENAARDSEEFFRGVDQAAARADAEARARIEATGGPR
ncbi:hypothetical protein [Amycolatopsis pigmentata]|uniref:Uncharacterized protein n=1 Tax=Amycolatopsis pigmentata TaxID=450801 RepID=A0ABW5G6B1_9PSEU